LPGALPVFPLGGVLLLPRGRLPLNVFEPRYLAMVDDVMGRHRLIGIIQPEGGSVSGSPALRMIGCAGRITSLSETEDGRYLISLSGIARFRVTAELATSTPYRQVQPNFEEFQADLIEHTDDANSAHAIDRQRLLAALRRYLDANQMKTDWAGIEEAEMDTLVTSLAMICPFEAAEKQALLEAPGLRDRADVLTALLEMAAAGALGGATPPVQ
jgi:Lon protease-like protein